MTFTVPALDISVAPALTPTTLSVTGEVDFATANQLRECIVQALVHGSGSVHLDLSGVEFMDTSGIHVLLAGDRRAALMGGHLGLVAASPLVRRLLKLAQIGTSSAPPNCLCRLVRDRRRLAAVG